MTRFELDRRPALLVRPKLTVGRARDAAEVKADRAAHAALAEVGRPGAAHHAGGGPDALGGLAVDPAFEARINRQRAGGRPLDDAARTTLEPAFGHDLSAVRVHADGEAAALSRSLQASAFTTGNDIFFAGSAYAPSTRDGLGLLAHEVAHVVQQGGAVQRAVVQRAFDPKNPNPDSIAAATRLTGGMANKGVFLLTGDGNAQLVAKFVDEDPRRAQMADVVLGTAGVGSAESQPYGMDVGRKITAKIRQLATEKRQLGDDATAAALEAGADKAEAEANGVVLMKKMTGVDLGDVLVGFNKKPPPDLQNKAQASGIDPIQLLQNPQFHFNLGKLYVADGLLGSSDRLSHVGFRVTFNTKNLKALADGTINTFDSDTVLIGRDQLLKKKNKDQSAEHWTKWLLEGGLVKQVGIQAPGGDAQGIVHMFDAASRQDVHKEIVATFKQLASGLDWSSFDLPFATFDKRFLAGIIAALTALVADIDKLVKSAETVGAADKGGGAIDPAALAVKGEFFKHALPELVKSGTMDDTAKAGGQAKALALAEKFAPRKDIDERAQRLAAFDDSLLPVPAREAELGVPEKVGRTFGRLIGSIGGSSAKSVESKRAKTLRKGADTMDRTSLDTAYDEVKKLAGSSHRKVHAQFDIGLRRSVLAIHGRAVDFGNADGDVMKLQTATSDLRTLRLQLTPYFGRLQNGQIDATQQKFKQVIDGYKLGLNRTGDADELKELRKAEQTLTDERGNFEAAVDWIDRMLKKAGV